MNSTMISLYPDKNQYEKQEVAFLKENALKQKNNKDQLELAAFSEKSKRTLLRISTVFPFDLFADELIIDESKVSIIIRNFFAVEQIYSIPFSEIVDVIIEAAPLFATLKLRDRGWDKSVSIKYLKKDDALKARRIIEGILILQSQKIDLLQFDPPSLSEYLENIGRARHD